MHNPRRAVAAVKISLTAIAFGPSVLYAQLGGQWQPLVNGAIPQGAVVLRAADGAPEYVCQTVVAGEAAIGVASQGVCRTGTAANPAESSQFSVLVVGSRSALRFAGVVTERLTPQTATNLAAAQRPAGPPGPPGGLTVDGGGNGARGGAGDSGTRTAAEERIAGTVADPGNFAVLSPPRVRAECAGILGQPEAGATDVLPGIDPETGTPYIEAVMPDGTRRRITEGGVEVFVPNGTSFYCSPDRLMSNAQPPTPPELPVDPSRGRAWMENHSDELLEVIRRITNDQVVAAVQAAEPKATGDDVFKKITYRTAVADFYAKRLP